VKRTQSSLLAITTLVAVAAIQGLAGCESGGPATPDTTDPPPPTTGAVTGVVASDAGGTVSGATVTLARLGSASLNTTSGSDGSFSFATVEAGQWQASVAPVAGFKTGSESTATVTVVSNQTATVNLELEAEPLRGAVEGRVLSGGTGVEGATVALDAAGGNVGQTTSDSDGDYEFEDLDAGSYTVTVTPPSGFQIAQGDSASRTVTVVEGDTAKVDFALDRQALSGSVVINLVNFAFSDPNGSNSTVIRKGTTVRWVQTTGTFHTVTPDGHTQFQNRDMPAGAPSFEVTFNTEGTFAYFCSPHRGAGMTGTIEVVS
jgi:plastocyanin